MHRSRPILSLEYLNISTTYEDEKVCKNISIFRSSVSILTYLIFEPVFSPPTALYPIAKP